MPPSADHLSMLTHEHPVRVKRAFHILLGLDSSRAGEAGLNILDRPLLKKIYRRQALARHPDQTGDDGRDFNELQEAYRLLDGLLAESPDAIRSLVSGAGIVATAAEQPATPAEPARRSDRRHPSPDLPPHPLRFGQFLHYRGLISREELIDSLVWQARSRPFFGSIACKSGFLGRDAYRAVMEGRQVGELIGDAAVRLGYMDNYQRLVVLGHQRRFQAEIGRYFLERGVLDPDGLALELAAQRRHNQRCHQIRR